jgi:transcriptional regulator with XRE-family HTH domain
MELMDDGLPPGFGAYVRERRERLGLSQTDLADLVGIRKGYMSQIESGKIGLPGADLRRRLAAALRVRHVDLLIAAGELTADEIPAPGAPPPPSEVERLVDGLAPRFRGPLLDLLREMESESRVLELLSPEGSAPARR